MIDAHTQPKYLQLLEHQDLRSFVKGIMDWKKEILLKRTMIRHNAPHALSTGVHYDKLFLRKGRLNSSQRGCLSVRSIGYVAYLIPSAMAN